MEFLKNYGLVDSDIEEILNANSKSIVNNLILNQKNVMEIIEYFQELGVSVETIKNMLVYQIGVFHKTKKELVTAFDEYEMESIIKSLNFDVNTFDMIEF